MKIASIRLAALVCAASLSACVVAPYPYPYATAPGTVPGGEVMVEANVAPPAVYTEVIPVMPYAGAVWISGYWGWSGRQHHWVGGNWVQPRPGFRWQPHYWQRNRHGGWVLHGGQWMR
jgi:WXXGXW repeat (2 copies)